MPAVSTDLAERIQQLEAERQQHADAIATIDDTLERVRSLLGAARNGRQAATLGVEVKPVAVPAAKPARKGRRRQGFKITGEESILQFVREHKNPTTAEITAQWKDEGRGGTANNPLTRLVADKKLKRVPNKGGRGSRYVLA